MFSPRPLLHLHPRVYLHTTTRLIRTTNYLTRTIPSPSTAILSSFLSRLRLQAAQLTTTAPTMTDSFKLVDITTLQDLKPGEKREATVEGVADGKVLLTNVGGKISAVGSKCTHYGAPLVKGVLGEDGRLTCPWHGG